MNETIEVSIFKDGAVRNYRVPVSGVIYGTWCYECSNDITYPTIEEANAHNQDLCEHCEGSRVEVYCMIKCLNNAVPT